MPETGIQMTLEKDQYFLSHDDKMEFIAKGEYKQALEQGLEKFPNCIKVPKGTKGECVDILVDKHDEKGTINVLFMLYFKDYDVTDYVSPEDVMEKV